MAGARSRFDCQFDGPPETDASLNISSGHFLLCGNSHVRSPQLPQVAEVSYKRDPDSSPLTVF